MVQQLAKVFGQSLIEIAFIGFIIKTIVLPERDKR